MGRVCTVCQAPERDAIDHELVAVSAPLRDIAGRHGLSKTSVHRHAAEHLPADLLDAFQTAEAERKGGLLEQVRELTDAARRILADAEAAGDRRGALDAIRTAGQVLTLLAKVSGELDERAQVNVGVVVSPEWARIRAVVLDVLDPWPEVRATLAGRLAELEAAE